MKFIIDNPLGVSLAAGLRDGGQDCVHVREYGMGRASDDDIFERAAAEDRTIITTDLGFAAILALSGRRSPSLILMRTETRRVSRLLPLLLANFPAIQYRIEQGAIVVFEEGRIRVRTLPLHEEEQQGPI